MAIDPRTYISLKRNGRTAVDKTVVDGEGNEGDTSATAVVTINYYDRETGSTVPHTEQADLEALRITRQKTAEDLAALDELIGDIETALEGKS